MCGLAGVLTHEHLRSEDLRRFVHQMSEVITHRGPDDSGIWTDAAAGVAFGFRRLAIVELSDLGHQPMISEHGRFCIAFNGEVFNHSALRAELEGSGVRFRGHSDTEVILAAFERWGIEPAVQRFIGMFAIAAWDFGRRRLTLIRDRLGIKPLYYAHSPGVLTFGSELKSLRAAPSFDPTVDERALTSYLRYLYVPAPATIYRAARKLLPGHILHIDDVSAALPASTPFWSLADVARRGREEPFQGSEEDAVDHLDQLLSDAVRLRMMADVPLGALLSGGVDSSVLVALMQRRSDRPIKTFAIGFGAAEHNEAHHAANVAQYLGTDHTELLLDGSEALSIVPMLPDMFDEPLADPSLIPTYLVFALAGREVTVALTGDGGDEVFAGYNRYIHGERMIRELSRVPRAIRRAAATALQLGGPDTWAQAYQQLERFIPEVARQRLPGEKLRKLSNMMGGDSPSAMYRSLLSSWQQPPSLHSREDDDDLMTGLLHANRHLPMLDRMMLADQSTYLPDDLLAKVDRASMAVSLEARVPLLDHRIVEFGWQLPTDHKIRDRRGKWLLRKVLDRYVPGHLVDRPKVGFSVPIADWLAGALSGWAESHIHELRSDDPHLDVGRVRSAWERFRAGEKDLALPIWTVLVYLAWRKRWIG